VGEGDDLAGDIMSGDGIWLEALAQSGYQDGDGTHD
jgi:hypothetical protein